MNTRILTVVLYLAVFIMVTFGLIYYNNKYTNIFHMDFSPLLSADSLATIQKIDSLKKLYGNDYLSKMNQNLNIDTNKIENKKNNNEEPIYLAAEDTIKKPLVIKEDTAKIRQQEEYLKWKEETVKILEQLEPKKAAKLISNYSDNVGRDLIYSMNKKKAAKIISELDTETAKNILRAN